MKPLQAISIAGLIAVSACSSHGAALPPGEQTAATTGAKLTVIVPRASTPATASSIRRPQYVSPSSTQLQVAVNGAAPATYGLTPSSPGCSIVSANLTCTFTVAAAAGNDSFTLTLTDASGAVLSRNVVNASLAAGASTPIDVTLAGIPATVRAVPGPNATIEGTPQAYHIPGLLPQPIELEALDADGNVIIGPGAPIIGAPSITTGAAYASVASAQSTDPNAYVLRTVSGAAGGQSVTITASAQSIALNDGSSSSPASGSTSFTYTPALAVGAGTLIIFYSVETGKKVGGFAPCSGACGTTIINALTTDSAGNVYVEYSSFGGLQVGHTVVQFPAGSSAPNRVLSSANGVTGPGGIAVDSHGMLYVANAAAGFFPHRTAAKITEYAPGATTPKYSISGSSSGITTPDGIAADASGRVYLSQLDGTIKLYGAGNQTAPQQTLSDPSLSQPEAILVDGTGGIYVVDGANLDIAYFAPGSTSVTNTLTASDFGAPPSSMTFDPNGNLWVCVAANNVINKFDATALPNSLSLLQSITGSGNLAWVP